MVDGIGEMIEALAQLLDALVNFSTADFSALRRQSGGVIESLPQLPIPPVRSSLSPAGSGDDPHTS